MKTSLFATFLVTTLISSPLWAQDKPKTPMKAAPASPEIATDGSVTFRVRAPKAQEVKVKGQFGKETSLVKDEQGLWSVTVPNVKPGVWEYNFLVDGMGTLDQLNPWIKPQRNPGSSILHIPSQPAALWDLTDVPHGIVSQLDYFSKSCQSWRGLTVYTPPGSLQTGEPLPVLYLSHGFSDNEKSWTVHGKAHWILDNLIAQKKAKPMIIVMPDGHAIAPGTGWKEEYGRENTRIYCQDLVNDVLPLVEKTFKVKASPDQRAFAGLSMGGRHAITVALNFHDKFHYVGAFSAAPPQLDEVAAGLDNSTATNGDLKLFWIGCGKEDFLFQANEGFQKVLAEKKVTSEYVTTAGDHSWPIWRNYLATFAPKLFLP